MEIYSKPLLRFTTWNSFALKHLEGIHSAYCTTKQGEHHGFSNLNKLDDNAKHLTTEDSIHYSLDPLLEQQKEFTPVSLFCNNYLKIVTWNLNNLDLSLLSGSQCYCFFDKSVYCSSFKNLVHSSKYSKDNSHDSKRNSSEASKTLKAHKKLTLILNQLAIVAPDILFVQELKNSCTLRILTEALNMKHGFQKFYCMSEFPQCEERFSSPSIVSLYDYDQRLSKKFHIKGVIYSMSSLLYHPILLVPKRFDSKGHSQIFPLGSCAFSCLLYPKRTTTTTTTPVVVVENDLIEIDVEGEQQQQQLKENNFQPLVVITCVHLSSNKNPHNVFIRQNQASQLKNWIHSCVFGWLEQHALLSRVSHWMALGDFNDCDFQVTDWRGSWTLSMDPSIQVIEYLKDLYRTTDQIQGKLFCQRRLENSSRLRPQNTRFSASMIHDYENMTEFSCAYCHILISNNFEECDSLSQLRVRNGMSAPSHFVDLCQKNLYLLNIYCSPLLGQDLSIINSLSLSSYLESFSCSDYYKGYVRKHNITPTPVFIHQIKQHPEMRKWFYYCYMKFINQEIDKLENPLGVIQTPMGYPSDHIPVYYTVYR